MNGGFGFRNWNTSVPAFGEAWLERDEFNTLSDRSLAEQLRLVRGAGAPKPGAIAARAASSATAC